MIIYDMYKCFGMYNRIMKDTQSPKIDTVKVIEKYVSDNNISIIDFILDYTKIQYTEDNICRYIDFVLYLDYDRTHEYIYYIFNEYIFKSKLLDKIKHYDIILDYIDDIYKDGIELTDDILIYLNKHIPITSFDATDNYKITDKSIKCLTNLKTLIVNWNTLITDESVKHLTNLTTLGAHGNILKITDESVKHLKKLKELDAGCNEKITDESVKCLKKLKHLYASDNSKITDESIKHLTHLKSLDASDNKKITDESVKYLTNLTALEACNNSKITDKSVKCLTKLTYLNAIDNSKITLKSNKKLQVDR